MSQLMGVDYEQVESREQRNVGVSRLQGGIVVEELAIFEGTVRWRPSGTRGLLKKQDCEN